MEEAGTGRPAIAAERASLQPSTGRRDFLLRLLVTAAAVVIVSWQVLVPPIVGIADNGDFSKVLGPYNIHSPAYMEYISPKLNLDPAYDYDPGFFSAERVLVRLAAAFNEFVWRDGKFDLRLIGVIHAALFVAAIYLFVPVLSLLSFPLRVVLCAAALLILGDVMYVSYMNSFYMDVPSYLMLLWTAVFYMRALAWRKTTDAVFFVASSLILVVSKPQYAVLALWLAALVWVARGPLWRGRKLVAGVVAAGILAAGLAAYGLEAPPGYAANNCFNVVFFQILPSSRNLDRAMKELRLDDSYRQWIGYTAYSPGSRMGEPDFSRAFLQRVDYGRLGRFYLLHPLDMWRALQASLSRATRLRPQLGNFSASAGLAPFAESRTFALWSNLKREVFDQNGSRMFYAFLGWAALVAVLLYRRRQVLSAEAIAGVLALIGTALTEMLIGALADVVDPVRHQLLFFAEFDLLVLVAVWLAWRAPAKVTAGDGVENARSVGGR